MNATARSNGAITALTRFADFRRVGEVGFEGESLAQGPEGLPGNRFWAAGNCNQHARVIPQKITLSRPLRFLYYSRNRQAQRKAVNRGLEVRKRRHKIPFRDDADG